MKTILNEEDLANLSFQTAKNIAEGEYNGFMSNDCILVKLILENATLTAYKRKDKLTCRQLRNFDNLTKYLLYG